MSPPRVPPAPLQRFRTEFRVLEAVRPGLVLAFMLHVPLLISLRITVRPFPLPATVKGFLVGLTAVAGSFALAWLIKT